MPPFNPNQSNQPAQTAANILSGDKSYQSVRYAITGDSQIDFSAGILAVAREYVVPKMFLIQALEMIALRLREEDRREKEMYSQVYGASGTAGDSSVAEFKRAMEAEKAAQCQPSVTSVSPWAQSSPNAIWQGVASGVANGLHTTGLPTINERER